MMTNKIALIIGLVLFNIALIAQEQTFALHLEPFTISDLGGIQSYAYGQHNGRWIIVGGRLDGLHRIQPWAAFDEAGHNNQLIVIDPLNQQVWTSPLTGLAGSIREQLSSTNMEFYQEGDYLYCLGGYGYSPSQMDHTTFDNMTAIHVPELIQAIIDNDQIAPFFRQVTHANFQVTGGKLRKIDDIYHLLGGQKFLGRYNPMGPDNGPGFIQEYTNSVRRFTIADDGDNIQVEFLPAFIDSINLHRRDYNAESQIGADLEESITMFSGVFQYDENLPFLNSVDIHIENYNVNNDFQQKFNHYHCPTLPIYSEQDSMMHNLFFGGIAQFYQHNGAIVQDDNVPFVKTISNVTRDATGQMVEHKMGIEMPSFLGAGAEFIPNLDNAHYANGVFKLDQILTDTTLMGYIYGGISSSQNNIFFVNDGAQSSANDVLFKVFLVKNLVTSVEDVEHVALKGLDPVIFPNPNAGTFLIKYNLAQNTDVLFTISNLDGKVIQKRTLANQEVGKNSVLFEMSDLNWGGAYIVLIETKYSTIRQIILVQE